MTDDNMAQVEREAAEKLAKTSDPQRRAIIQGALAIARLRWEHRPGSAEPWDIVTFTTILLAAYAACRIEEARTVEQIDVAQPEKMAQLTPEIIQEVLRAIFRAAGHDEVEPVVVRAEPPRMPRALVEALAALTALLERRDDDTTDDKPRGPYDIN